MGQTGLQEKRKRLPPAFPLICALRERWCSMTEFTMEEKAKAAKAAYMREWNAKNRDRRKAANEKYWVRKYDEMQAAETAKRGK